MNIKEGFDLPDGSDSKIEKLSQFIGSFFLSDLEKQSDDIVNKNENIRLAKNYRDVGASLFNVKKKLTVGDSNKQFGLLVSTVDEDLPNIHIRIEEVDKESNYAYVLMIKNVPTVFLIISKYHFLKDFNQSVLDLDDTLKHEIRHFLQFTGDKNVTIGLPKKKLKNKDVDIYGRKSNGETKPHYMQDIEFKTNVHTYAHYFKSYLNKNYAKQDWFKMFKKMMVDGLNNYTNDNKIDSFMVNINHLKRKDKPRWKQFVIELYKEIFK